MLHKVCNNNSFPGYKINRYDSIFGNTWDNGTSTHLVFYVFTHMAKPNSTMRPTLPIYPHIPWVMLNVWENVCCHNKLTLKSNKDKLDMNILLFTFPAATYSVIKQCLPIRSIISNHLPGTMTSSTLSYYYTYG